jgi:hypothetical protein
MGDTVMISEVDPKEKYVNLSTSIFGTVKSLAPNFLVTLNPIPSNAGKTLWRVDSIGNLTTYKRQINALLTFLNPAEPSIISSFTRPTY